MAMVYDGVALFAVAYVAGFIALLAHHGVAFAANDHRFQIYLLGAIYAYFAYCWRRGQTLGMRSWKIRLVDAASGGAPSWRQVSVRFAVALLSWLAAGLGFIWAVIDPAGRAWHDRASGTRLVRR
jgi:uncharacterized RDD family membrane protein YckC